MNFARRNNEPPMIKNFCAFWKQKSNRGNELFSDKNNNMNLDFYVNLDFCVKFSARVRHRKRVGLDNLCRIAQSVNQISFDRVGTMSPKWKKKGKLQRPTTELYDRQQLEN